MAEYCPDYVADDQDKFDQMLKMFGSAKDPDELRTVTVMFILDLEYSRKDIMVAVRRTERNKGWD